VSAAANDSPRRLLRFDEVASRVGLGRSAIYGRAYNRTAHLPERRQMMQAWADYLAKLAE